MISREDVGQLVFNADGLIPAIAQDCRTGQVLMLAYMNRESLLRTLEIGRACYWSLRGGELWTKGETSGHYQLVKDIVVDCDRDTLLLSVEQVGPACHTGAQSCFESWAQSGNAAASAAAGERGEGSEFSLQELYEVLLQRKAHGDPEASYTARLMRAGKDRVLKKLAEEAGEVMLASKNDDPGEIVYETADLRFHSLMVLAYHGIPPQAVLDELARRRR